VFYVVHGNGNGDIIERERDVFIEGLAIFEMPANPKRLETRVY
jgi:hypothetical protein